jgi:hypothetical protein
MTTSLQIDCADIGWPWLVIEAPDLLELEDDIQTAKRPKDLLAFLTRWCGYRRRLMSILARCDDPRCRTEQAAETAKQHLLALHRSCASSSICFRGGQL